MSSGLMPQTVGGPRPGVKFGQLLRRSAKPAVCAGDECVIDRAFPQQTRQHRRDSNTSLPGVIARCRSRVGGGVGATRVDDDEL